MNTFREVIVCYDISENKARKKVSDGLKDLGLISIQKSVYWGQLLPAEEKTVLLLLRKWVPKDADNRAFIVPAGLSNRIQHWSVGYKNTLELFNEPAYCVI